MNDRFKFRFWREHYDGKFTLEHADLMSIDGSAEPYNVGEGDVYCYYPGETIIEQCTGIKDKNGNLVFEGDVVRINGMQESFEVVYAKNLCGFGLKHADGLITSVTPSVLGCVEVVANIHENPELLK